jgi:VanZ family protein
VDTAPAASLRVLRRVRINRGERRRLQWWCVLAAAGVAILAAYVSVVPFNFAAPPAGLPLTDHLLQGTLRASQISIPNLLANVVMFIPFGFFGAGSFVDERSRLRSWSAAVVLVLGASIVWSLAIETVQVLLPGRTSSLPDVVAQTLGTIAGIGAWAFLAREVRTFTSSFVTGGRRALEGGLAIYAVIRFFLLLQPFNVTVEVSSIMRKFRTGGVVLNPLRSPALDWHLLPSLLSDVVMALPVGVLAAIAGCPRGVRRPAGSAIAMGAAFFVAGEVAQVFVRSRTADVVDLLANCLGVAAGVLLTAVVMARPATSAEGRRTRHRALEAGLALSLLVYGAINLTPFDFSLSRELIAERIGRLTSVPFAGYYQNQEFKALADLLTKITIALPLGVLFHLRARPDLSPYRRTLTAGWLLVTGLFFLGVEFGQVLLPTRFPESTDVLIGVFAVWLGMRVTRPFA